MDNLSLTYKPTPTTTIKRLAQEALDIQEIDNLGECIKRFSSALIELQDIAKMEGWYTDDAVNEHSVCVLFADKIASIACPDQSMIGGDFFRAYNWARDIVSE